MNGEAWERVCALIQGELLEVQKIVRQSLHFHKAPAAGEPEELLIFTSQHTLPSVLVLLCARLFGPPAAPVIALAAVVHFIYLAARSHQRVQEWPGTGDPRECYQYPVLVGDYLYSHFFNCLCRHDILPYLRPLAQVICQISEGSILRLQNKDCPSPELLKKAALKEVALLVGKGCRLAAHLCRASEEEEEILYRFGLNYGMALALSDLGFEVSAYIKRALALLDRLPLGEAREALKELVVLCCRPAYPDLAVQVV